MHLSYPSVIIMSELRPKAKPAKPEYPDPSSIPFLFLNYS
jgi:hypothetical protein